MKPKVYLETSVISYLAARPSRDLVVAAHQQITETWWAERADAFDLFISELVVQEASAGDARAAAKRVRLLKELPILHLEDSAIELATELVAHGAVPEVARNDAVHIALSTVHEMTYLLTWNCKHIANLQLQHRISMICRELGFVMPMIGTPEELLGD